MSPSTPRRRVLRWIMLGVSLLVVSTASYCGYVTAVQVPQAKAAVLRFLAALERRDLRAAYAIMPPQVQEQKSQATFDAEFDRADFLMTGIKDLSVTGFDRLAGSLLVLRARVVYAAGPSGGAEFVARRGPAGWQVESANFRCAEMFALQRRQAQDVALRFLETLRGGSLEELRRQMHPRLIASIPPEVIERSARLFTARVTSVRIVEERTQASHPAYRVAASVRRQDGGSQPATVDVLRSQGRLWIVAFQI